MAKKKSGCAKFGLAFLALITLSTTLFFFAVSSFLTKENLERFSGTVLRTAFSVTMTRQMGKPARVLDDAEALRLLKQRARAAGGGNFRPVPRINLVLNAAEIEKLEPNQVWDYIGKKFTAALYERGPAEFFSAVGSSAGRRDPDWQRMMEFMKGVSFDDIKARFNAFKIADLVISLLLLAAFAFMLTGWWRLVGAGLVVTVAGLPGFLFHSLLNWVWSSGQVSSQPGVDAATMKSLWQGFLQPVSETVRATYLPPLIIGVVMVVGGFIMTRIAAGKGKGSQGGSSAQTSPNFNPNPPGQ